MAKEGSKEASSTCASYNVIDMNAYRRRKSHLPQHHLLYITDESPHGDAIQGIPSAATDIVASLETLRVAFVRRNHDLVFVDSDLSWADPVELIERMTRLSSPPILLLCSQTGARNNAMLKRAFAAGLHDTLFAPLSHEDLLESVEVLLKLRRHVSPAPFA